MVPEKGDIWSYDFAGFGKRYLFLEMLFSGPNGQKWQVLCLDDGTRGVAHCIPLTARNWRKVA